MRRLVRAYNPRMRLAPWLAVPLLAASLHAQAVRPGSTTPVTTEFRVFNGTEEITASTRLRIVPAGRRDAPAIEASRSTVPLAPAVYGVQALRVRGAGVITIKWVERLAVMHYPDEGGRHLEVINFQPGYGALQLRSSGRLDPSEVAVFAAGDRTVVAGRPVTGDGYVLVVARAGRYDVRIEHADHGGGRDTHWMLAVDVPAGRTRLKVIDAP